MKLFVLDYLSRNWPPNCLGEPVCIAEFVDSLRLDVAHPENPSKHLFLH